MRPVNGLDFATDVNGIPAFGGKLFEEPIGHSTIAGTDALTLPFL